MCGRFTQTYTWSEIVELYRIMNDIAPTLPLSWNIAPSQTAGTIVLDEEKRLHFQPMHWGLVPFWAKDPSIGSKLINARAETLAGKPAFRHALKSRRCVVPVSGFYEWQKIGKGRQPYFVTSADGKPLALAGLWERWNDLLTFTIVTVPANEALLPVHDRMPAVLTPEDALQWLRNADIALLKPCPSASLAIWPVSTRVNSPANDGPALIESVASALPSADAGPNTGTAQLRLAL